jgi:hypothetical protein
MTIPHAIPMSSTVRFREGSIEGLFWPRLYENAGGRFTAWHFRARTIDNDRFDSAFRVLSRLRGVRHEFSRSLDPLVIAVGATKRQSGRGKALQKQGPELR